MRRTSRAPIPAECSWPQLLGKDGDKLFDAEDIKSCEVESRNDLALTRYTESA